MLFSCNQGPSNAPPVRAGQSSSPFLGGARAGVGHWAEARLAWEVPGWQAAVIGRGNPEIPTL